MSRDLSTIAKNIKKHREKNGITQNELARYSGVTYNVLIKVESGATSNPTIDTVLKLARGLKVSVDELIKPQFSKNKLICTICSKEFSSEKRIWRCECGGFLTLYFESQFPIEKIKQRKPTMWRYREAIPIDKDTNIVSFNESITPLTEISIDNRNIFVKQDNLFTSGTYKDRGAAILISKVKEFGIDRIVEDSLIDDSSGSACNAITAYCAHANITCDLFTSISTNEDKLWAARLFGSKIHKVKGSISEIKKEVSNAINEEYYANHVWNPFFFQGLKTLSFEIWEQLDWKAPDTLILPVGNGTLLLGAYLGFFELYRAGVISNMPKIIGIQSIHCAPLYFAFKEHLFDIPKVTNNETFAEGIAISNPIRGKEILDAVSKTNGMFITVDTDEMISALREMYLQGYSIESTSAATIAGAKKYLKMSKKNEKIVSVLTGTGNKSKIRIHRVLIS